MADLLLAFEEKTSDIQVYLTALINLHEEDAKVYMPKKRKVGDRMFAIDGQLTAIMKANVHLMLYNLVEWSVREGILLIYRDIESTSCDYARLRTELKMIWTKYQYRQSFDVNSSWETYYGKAIDILQHALANKVIKMDRKAIPASGNLDADQIRLICDLHGIKKNTPSAARGGSSLSDVKEQRNLLAHGSLGFAECGRQFSLPQIRSMSAETISFSRGILKNIVEYHNNKQYLSS